MRSISTFASIIIVFSLYFLYGWGIVPLLLPLGGESIIKEPDSGREEVEPYLFLFPEGAWERLPETRIRFIQVGETIILYEKEEIGGNMVTLSPCTILFVPGIDASGQGESRLEELRRQAIVLRTPEYAEIEFDRELDFSKLSSAKIKQGTLVGKVTIESNMKDPGTEDDLLLETENIVFTESPASTVIRTRKDVRFRWGYHYGEGNTLRMDLARNPNDPNSSKELALVVFDTLKCLNLAFPEEAPEVTTDAHGQLVDAAFSTPSTPPASPASATPAISAAYSGSTTTDPSSTDTSSSLPPINELPALAMATPTSPPLPPLSQIPSPATVDIRSRRLERPHLPPGSATLIDITCKREFSFTADTEKPEKNWIAQFMGNVEVLRTLPDASSDLLTGEEVRINFKVKEADAIKSDPETRDMENLEPVKFVAFGKLGQGTHPPVPAKLTSMQNGGVQAVGDQIAYDMLEETLLLSTERKPGASKEVEMIYQDRYHVRSVEGFKYNIGKEGRFGNLFSQGKGHFQGTFGEGKNRKKTALSWNRLQIDPDPSLEDQILIKLGGGITVDMEGFGKMSAERLVFQCRVRPKAEAPGADSVRSPKSSQDPFGDGTSLVPLYAVVMDNVQFFSENGHCTVNRLDVIFKTVDGEGIVLQSPYPPLRLTARPPRYGQPASAATPAYLETKPLREARLGAPVRSAQFLQVGPPAPGTIRQTSGELAPLQVIQPSPPVAGPAPVVPPTPGSANALNVQTQNLLGLRTSNGRSFYEVTGDSMRMEVLNHQGQSQAKQIEIEGQVRIREQMSRQDAEPPIEVTGHKIIIWNPDSPETQILLQGNSAAPKEFRYAIFKAKGAKLTATELHVDRVTNMIWSPGPGQLLATSEKDPRSMILPAGAAPPVALAGSARGELVPLKAASEGDNRLFVEWNQEMRFDGKTIVFQGKPDKSSERVRAIYQYQQLWCNLMAINLTRMISFFEDSPEPEIEFIQCSENVSAESRSYDENNFLKSYDRAHFERIRYYPKSSYCVTEGAGEFRSTFVNSGKSALAPGQALLGSERTERNDEKNKLTYIFVKFQKKLTGRFLADFKEVDIFGGVEAVYSPVASWDDNIGIDNVTSAMKRGAFLLKCEHLQVAELPDPTRPGSHAAELTANQQASIEGQDFFGQAEKIMFTQAKSLVTFDGKASIRKSDGFSLNTQSFHYNLETGSVEGVRSQGFTLGP